MLTAVILMLSVALIVVVGESVRGQCRRMLSAPAQPVVPASAEAPANAGV